MPYANVNGVRLNYASYGKGRRFLVLLHGIGGNLHNFDSMIPAILKASKDLSVLCLDQRGFGKSDKPLDQKYSTSLWADDVHHLLRELKIQKASIGGHSMGGRIAAHYATKFPSETESLITLDTTAWGSNPRGANQLRRVRSRLPKEGMKAALVTTPWIKSLDKEHRHLAKNFEKDTLANDPRAYGLALDSVISDFENDDCSFLRNITCPTLIVVGDKDSAPLDGALKMKDSISDSRLAVIPDCGHYSMSEKTSILNAIVCDFISEVIKDNRKKK